ncbi:MAG: hypothetical protein GY820_38125, partial [Gammaproteobacteria bacterium]|nr:hypothetical protein [Gammaproteobacteria bacterium]
MTRLLRSLAAALHSRKQLQGETIAEFGRSLSELAKIAHGESVSEILTTGTLVDDRFNLFATLRYLFIEGLNPQMRQTARVLCPENLEGFNAVVQWVVQLERKIRGPEAESSARDSRDTYLLSEPHQDIDQNVMQICAAGTTQNAIMAPNNTGKPMEAKRPPQGKSYSDEDSQEDEWLRLNTVTAQPIVTHSDEEANKSTVEMLTDIRDKLQKWENDALAENCQVSTKSSTTDDPPVAYDLIDMSEPDDVATDIKPDEIPIAEVDLNRQDATQTREADANAGIWTAICDLRQELCDAQCELQNVKNSHKEEKEQWSIEKTRLENRILLVEGSQNSQPDQGQGAGQSDRARLQQVLLPPQIPPAACKPMVMDAEIVGMHVNALFDTGCTTNMMNSDTARKLGLKITPVGPTISRMANGDRLNVSGRTIVDLKVGAHVYESVPFLIAPLPMHEVFLGLQFQRCIAPFMVDFDLRGTGHVVTSNGEKLTFGKPREPWQPSAAAIVQGRTMGTRHQHDGSGEIAQLKMKSGKKHPVNPCSNQGK